MLNQNPFSGLGKPYDENKVKYQEKIKISKQPNKVLDAPQLSDDFYLNLVDWSESNNLAVALSQCVYIWSASSSQVAKLKDYSPND